MNKEEKAIYMKAYHAKHCTERREAHKRWKKNNPEARRIKRLRNKASNPLKHKARVKLANAVRDGKIIRSTFCEMCLTDKGIQAHHPDYGKPLEVVWLCGECHRLLHGNETKVA